MMDWDADTCIFCMVWCWEEWNWSQFCGRLWLFSIHAYQN